MKHTQKILSLSAAMAMIFVSSAWAGNGKGGPAEDRPLNGTCVADGTCTANPQGRDLAGTCLTDPEKTCLPGPKENNSQNWQGNRQQGSQVNCSADGTCSLLEQPLAEISEAEITTLSFMREEEKMARDVYITLYEVWQTPIFANISKAEQQHMDQIKLLLDSYELPDPAFEETGVFTNPDIQALYDSLVERGRTSQIEGLQVGALIEEVDIADLQNALAETENPALETIYTNLMNGSYNHLRGFVRNIEYLDYAYQAQHLSQEEVDDILNPAVVSRGIGLNADNSQLVATDAQFKPSIKNQKGRHGNAAVLSREDDITLSATFQPDSAHIGQNADLVTVATFTPMGSNQPMMFMRDEAGAWKNWDGNLDNLTAIQSQQRLHANQSLSIHQGQLAPGRYQVSMGYRLSDGTIILNGQPMDFWVE
ncbi:MAG: DUF2202 domain-containing protein [Candidatus Parabeggiatoa sp.]|nr:DUF2202 domain-containing protein [Candidatus Parabeggiatoa sp.]